MFKISGNCVMGFLYNIPSQKKILNIPHHNTLFSQTLSLIPRRIFSLEEALSKCSVPDIFNTDQSCQFTSFAFTNGLRSNGVGILMDSHRHWLDNVFIERFRRSHKV